MAWQPWSAESLEALALSIDAFDRDELKPMGMAMRGAAILLVWMMFSIEALAIEVQHEYRKRIESSQNLSALKNDLFGESVSLFNGKTEFSVTDIDVPGNNGLPVQLRRRFSVEIEPAGGSSFSANLDGAGGWDVDVPYITGMFGPVSGWSAQRCSGSMAPTVHSSFNLTDIWQGNTIHVPGGGDRTMLMPEAQTPLPSDGQTIKWTTNQRDAISCIPMKSGLEGEGYSVLTQAGVRYHFDTAVTRYAGSMRYSRGNDLLVATVSRSRVYVLASKVEDRFGNWVQYQYNGNGHPVRIWSSDGREITLAYDGQNLSTASSHGRTWQYQYQSVEGHARLQHVTQPDSSRWTYAYSNALKPSYVAWDGGSNSTCSIQPPPIEASFEFQATHPSGAVGTFTFGNRRHYRSGVHASECLQRIAQGTYYYVLSKPTFFDVMSLSRKTLAGPGIPQAQVWQYGYGGVSGGLWGTNGSAGAYPCTTCMKEKTVSVLNPDGSATSYRYGAQYALNEGRLLGTTVLDADGVVKRAEELTYMPDAEASVQSFFPRYGIIHNGDDPSTATVRPVIRKTIQQDGVEFISETAKGCGAATTYCFDSFAQPTQVRKFSPSHTRMEATEYHNDVTLWVLGQSKRASIDGIEASRVTHGWKSMPEVIYSFGKLQQTLTYNADGTVATVKDGNARVTTLGGWKRGIPQSIVYADTSTQSALVNDLGWITQVTDENGFFTSYSHDAMGRLASITYPLNDSTPWNKTLFAFEAVQSSEHGIPAGHWRQTISTGNARKVSYFDALWRPLIVQEYDNTNVAGTTRFSRFEYDYEGRTAFSAYPNVVSNSTKGIWTEFDALGRVTSVSQDSEQGPLTTLTEYLSGLQTRITDPRENQTTTSYVAYDQPGYDWPKAIAHPEGAYTDITRDVFGKPMMLTRRNASGTQIVTRSYGYDGHQQLCKSVEPETGATLMGYDGVGNLAWSAAGLPASTACDPSGATDAVAARKVSRTYDLRNRVKTLSFPDGRGNQVWTYTADGLPATLTTNNSNGGEQVISTYTYNKRRLPIAESLSQPNYTWSLGYSYDTNGALSGLTYPSGLQVGFVPNALGQPTRAGNYVTGASYYPNGALKQFTYGNGIVHSMTQNDRQLPLRVQSSGGVSGYQYEYDRNGNPTQIHDVVRGTNHSRTLQYDGLDRLTAAGSAMFGGDHWHRFTYDALDNVKSWKLAGVKDYANYYYETGTNRLLSIQNSAGAAIVGLDYDLQGNLANKNGQLYQFDFGNRLRQATNKETYRYDGHGRRVQASTPTQAHILSMYGQDGVLRRQEDHRAGRYYEYVTLAGSLVAKVITMVAPGAPNLTAPTYNSNGGYTVSWTAMATATSYELQESVNNGSWAAAYSGPGTSRAYSGKGNGVYRYQVRACQASSCSGWSNVGVTTVELPPAAAPNLSIPATAPNGNYTVSWTAVTGASTYNLEESANSGSWIGVQNTASQSKAYSGRTAGSYSYRVKACQGSSCSGWSNIGTTTVQLPPTAAPSLTVPATAPNGNYTVSWTAIGGAATYTLEESTNGGAWASVQNTASQNKAYSGKAAGSYSYRAKACNPAGCGPTSVAGATQVIHPPTTAPTLTVPSSSYTGGYTVSWTAVSGASTYRVEESSNGGGWILAQQPAVTSTALINKAHGSHAYRVQACNAAGCGAFSATKSIQVTLPPTSAPSLSVPASSNTGSYTVSWGSVTAATTYQLEERASAGAWTQIHNASGSSKAIAGKSTGAYEYRVRGCNAAGCGPHSPGRGIQVLLVPASPTITFSQKSQTSHSPIKLACSVKWTSIPHADRYELTAYSNGQLYQNQYNGPNTSVSTTLSQNSAKYCASAHVVRACNSVGCSPWSAPQTQAVEIIPVDPGSGIPI